MSLASLAPYPSNNRDVLVRAVDRLRKLSRLRPTLGIVLGSGFQNVTSRVRMAAESSYQELPGFHAATVLGHAGRLILGHLGKTPVLVLSGRLHYYEGHSMDAVTFPIRVLAEFGIQDILLTNAAGGINPRFHIGDFMSLSDHINFMGVNPLRGLSAEQRFVDLSRTYDRRLNRLIAAAARKIKLRLRAGVYLAVSGPCYETPAEIRAFARLGADAVGMSTVPEAIVARQCGLRVAAISCVTNLAAGLGKKAVSHAEVLATGKRVGQTAAELLQEFAELYAENS
jgi:purine-nucleoside phosphorylase